jgi:hypothetical protein
MLGLTIIYTGKYDGEAIKNAPPHIAKIYFGASSWALLDENGDRVGGATRGLWERSGSGMWRGGLCKKL